MCACLSVSVMKITMLIHYKFNTLYIIFLAGKVVLVSYHVGKLSLRHFLNIAIVSNLVTIRMIIELQSICSRAILFKIKKSQSFNISKSRRDFLSIKSLTKMCLLITFAANYMWYASIILFFLQFFYVFKHIVIRKNEMSCTYTMQKYFP